MVGLQVDVILIKSAIIKVINLISCCINQNQVVVGTAVIGARLSGGAELTANIL